MHHKKIACARARGRGILLPITTLVTTFMGPHSSSQARQDIVTTDTSEVALEGNLSLDLKNKLTHANGKYDAVLDRARKDDDAQEGFTSLAANMVVASALLAKCAISAVAKNH